MACQDEETIEAFIERIRSAWNAEDARRYASEFTEDATYVTWLGDALIGRGEIERTHADVFGKWRKGEQMVVRPIRVRPLGAGTVSVLTAGGLGDPIKYDKLQTFTLVLQDGRWMCSAFHNTRMNARAEEAFNGS
jgi:uncharacterized protein (TIGR02246 family)